MDVLSARYLLRHAHGGADLTAGITAIVAGDPGTAAGRLAGVADAGEDLASQVRAAAYHRLATYLTWNAFPGGGIANATEIQARWDGEASELEASRDWVALTAQVPDADVVLETRVVSGALCSLRLARSMAEFAALRSEPAEVDAQLDDLLRLVAPLREGGDAALRGYADVASADLAWRARRPDRAAQFLREAAATYGTAGDTIGVATCHLARGDWRAAPAGTLEARNLTLVASPTESSALDWALESVEASVDGLDVGGAQAAYAEAEQMLRDAGDDAARGLAAVALRRGYLAGLEGDHALAAERAGEAAAAFASCGDGWGRRLANVHEALAAIAAGRLTEAADTAEEIGQWGQSTGSFSYALGLGLLCSRTGRHWLYRSADHERALAAHRLARMVFAALGAVTDESQSLVDRGRVLQVVGDHEGAGAAYEEALDLLSADVTGRPAAAAANRLRSVTLAQTFFLLQLNRHNLTGMARGAERLAAQAARLPQERDEDSMEAMFAASASSTLATAAVVLPLYRAQDARDAGDANGAETGFAAALDAARSADTADTDFLEAVVLGHWRRYAESAEAFRRYLERQAAKNTGLVARVLSRMGPMKAERELAERRLHEQAAAFFRRARDYATAVEHFEALEASDGMRWWSSLERPWELLADYGAAREHLGELRRALELYDEAIAQLEARRARLRRDELKTALSGTVGAAALYIAAARTVLRMSEAAARSGDPSAADALSGRAFGYAERGRARGLLDLLGASTGLARSAPAARDAVRAWHQANTELSMRQGLLAAEQDAPVTDPDRLAALLGQITAAEEELARREADLERDDPDFAATVATPAGVLSVEEVAAALPEGTALLAYHQLDEDLLAWAVTRQGLAATHQVTVDDAELSRDIRAFSKACVVGRRWDEMGEALARAFLDPFTDVIEGSDGLVLVPPVGAQAVAFHALHWNDEPLGAHHPISYLPSASSIQFLGRREAAVPDRVLAVGDPSAMAWQALPGSRPGPAAALPGARTEAAFVAALFSDRRLLLGKDATESALRAEIGSYPVVHLATHGQLSEQAPLLSSVLLAEGEALSVYELMGVHLDADLVVLSACRSAGGEVTAGGDVLGLTRGLLGAGARGIIVTLWDTFDEAACVLMAHFYRRLRGGAPPAVALQHAQSTLRRTHRFVEEEQYAALRAAVEDPAGAAALLAPIGPTEEVEADYHRDRPSNYWAPFYYVGL